MQARLVKTYADESTDPLILQTWMVNWQANGWTTRVLTHWDARRHRRYADGIESHVMPWLAFATNSGGFWVAHSVLVRGDFTVPPINGGGVVVLSGEGARAAVWASIRGSFDLAASALDKTPMQGERRAELCVEAGSRDWDSAPLVYFSDHACKVHKREKLQWMREFAEKALEIEKIC